MTPDPTSRAVLEVLDGGLLTTVQDRGRPGWTHLGVPESGAADSWSLAVANLLIGNDPADAGLEITIGGPAVRIRRAITLGLAGSDLGARTESGRRLLPWRAHRLGPGDVITFGGGDRNVDRPTGARAYLALPGGIDVPEVLGSRSTCLAAAFGGFEGRPLAAGDVLAARRPGTPPEIAWPRDPHDRGDLGGPDGGARVLRVLPGPDPGLDALQAGEWTVATSSDRVGVRLEGPPLPDGIGGETTTHGVPIGAIQVPPDGRPILLGPDHQTTGGYRVVGVVISADLPVLGQLGPGMRVRIALTDRETAIAALAARRDALAAGAVALREAAAWDELAESAGG